MELQEICGYLPYGLKCKYDDDKTIFTINPLLTEIDYVNEEFPLYHIIGKDKAMPILRPLSDLTKEIVVEDYNDGKPFVPKDVIVSFINPYYKEEIMFQDIGIWYDEISDKFEINTDLLPLFVANLLYQWHFDIHGLIEKGEAIDMNTLKEK